MMVSLNVPISGRRFVLALLLQLVGAREVEEVQTSENTRHDGERKVDDGSCEHGESMGRWSVKEDERKTGGRTSAILWTLRRGEQPGRQDTSRVGHDESHGDRCSAAVVLVSASRSALRSKLELSLVGD
jgi:hypothetical protein